MATLDLTAFEAAMKIDYLAGVNDNSVRSAVLLNKINRTSEGVGGNFAQLSLLRRGNPAVASRGEGATLQTPNFSKHEKATFNMQTIYGRAEISGKVTRAASHGDGVAFVDAIDAEMQSLMVDAPSEHNRMLFGLGTGQLISSLDATTAKKTITVDSVQYFNEDDIVDMTDSAGGAIATVTAVITVVDPDNKLITIGANVTVTNGTTLIYRGGSRGQEIFGLRNICATDNPGVGAPTANYGGIDRTTAGNRFWRGNHLVNPVTAGTNRTLTRGLMQNALMESHKRGKGTVDLVIADSDMWMTYGNILAPDQRWNDQIYEMDGGFAALKFVNLDFSFDIDAPPNSIFFLETDSLALFEYDDGYEFMSADGSILRYASSGDKDVIQFAILKDAQFGCRACNRQVWLDDLSVNTG